MRLLGPNDPAQIGGYQLLCPLGQGGMGQVYLGHSPAGVPVAVKVIKPEHASDPDFLARFRSEVIAAKRVSGAYTAAVLEAGPNDRPPWLVTEFVPGPSLAEAVEKADRVIVTDDNPRSEDPASIRAAILAAAPGALEIGDRRSAIVRAVADLEPGDVLLIAGKGHETGQIVGNKVLPFSDQETAREAIAAASKT